MPFPFVPLLLMGAGTAAGFLIADNGQKAIVKNEYIEDIRQAVTSSMTSRTEAQAQAICENVVDFENLQCCRIKIGTQTCEATALQQASISQSFSSNLTADLVTQLSQLADASNEGLGIGQESNASSVVKKTIDVSVGATQVFMTDCSKLAKGLNIQTYKNLTCGGIDPVTGACVYGDGWDYEVGTQEISVSATGNCIVDTIGNADAASSLASYTDQISKAKNVGIDFFGLFLAMIAPIMIFIIVPIGFKILTSKSKGGRETEEAKSAARRRSGQSAMMTMVLVVCILIAVWYPGLITSALGISWSEQPYQDLGLCTSDGRLRETNYVINDSMWYDKDCLYKKLQQLPTSGCNDDERIRAYQTCGVFAKERICRDPQLLTDRDEFARMLEACNEVTGMVQDNSARAADGSPISFAFCDSESAASATLRGSYGPACRRCLPAAGDPASVAGLFARLDPAKANLPQCQSADGATPADECYLPCTGISSDKYLISGVYYDRTGQAITRQCALTDPDCVGTEAAYRQQFPDECTDPLYMEGKEAYVRLNRACAAVNTLFERRFPAQTKFLSSMCPPSAFNWMDCDPITKRCGYKPQSQPGDTQYEAEALACANNFSKCTDADFLADKDAQDKAEERCRVNYENTESYRWWRNRTPVISIVLYVILLGIGVGALLHGGRAVEVEVVKTSSKKDKEEEEEEEDKEEEDKEEGKSKGWGWFPFGKKKNQKSKK